MILPSTRLLEASDIPKSRKQIINFITVFRFWSVSITVLKKHKHEQNKIAVNTEYQILSNFLNSNLIKRIKETIFPKRGKNSECVLKRRLEKI